MNSRLNLFPGYPVATIAGHLDWTAPTEDVKQARDFVRDFVAKWRPESAAPKSKESGAQAAQQSSSPSDNVKKESLSDRAAIILVSGDYGTGKTHVLLEIDSTVRDLFYRRNVPKANVLRVAGIEADPATWYRNSIGPVLNDLGGKSPDGGWFAQLALQVYAEAAKGFLSQPEKLTDPAAAFQLVRNGILNATTVGEAYSSLINEACGKYSEAMRSQLAALLDRRRRPDAERWLSGNPVTTSENDPGAASAEPLKDGEAIDILGAAAALSIRVGRPFAILIDEIELFLRVDDRSNIETNTTWLKRLLSELAKAGALVAVSGHRSTWDRRSDFLQRFSFGKRIDMRRLSADDVLDLVSWRLGTSEEIAFDLTQAEAVADATRGNIRRVLSLCRVLFDQSDGFTKRLNPEDIGSEAIQLSQAPSRDQVLLKVQELFEARRLSIGSDLIRSRSIKFEFDLVARSGSGSGSYFIVMVRATPAEKEAQDFARQFIEQLRAVKRRDDHISAFLLRRIAIFSPAPAWRKESNSSGSTTPIRASSIRSRAPSMPK